MVPTELSREKWTSSAWSAFMRDSFRRCSVRSRMNAVKRKWSPIFASPILRSIGKSEPSARRAVTVRPMPMIRRSPVRR